MTGKPQFITKYLAEEFCYYIGRDPDCMEHCFIKEPMGNKSVMVPVCQYAKVYPRTLDEGTRDLWDFDKCELRARGVDYLDRWLWAVDECPYFTELLDAFLEDYARWARE